MNELRRFVRPGLGQLRRAALHADAHRLRPTRNDRPVRWQRVVATALSDAWAAPIASHIETICRHPPSPLDRHSALAASATQRTRTPTDSNRVANSRECFE
ncbi:MAG: hypothetical protein FJ256_03925 [Phycisphaerae bacterium]|nr:hypothetical protein [Phycisphaerae bacterium]